MNQMENGGVIVFDDYCWPAKFGARQAIDEVCAGWNEEILSVPATMQAFLMKR